MGGAALPSNLDPPAPKKPLLKREEYKRFLSQNKKAVLFEIRLF